MTGPLGKGNLGYRAAETASVAPVPVAGAVAEEMALEQIDDAESQSEAKPDAALKLNAAERMQQIDQELVPWLRAEILYRTV